MVWHALGIGQAALAKSPAITPRRGDKAVLKLARVAGKSFLLRVIPLEDTVGGDTLVEHHGQGRDFQIRLVGYEATAVTPTTGTGREGHHVASLELEAKILPQVSTVKFPAIWWIVIFDIFLSLTS